MQYALERHGIQQYSSRACTCASVHSGLFPQSVVNRRRRYLPRSTIASYRCVRFCNDCINRWLRIRRACPACNEEVHAVLRDILNEYEFTRVFASGVERVVRCLHAPRRRALQQETVDDRGGAEVTPAAWTSKKALRQWMQRDIEAALQEERSSSSFDMIWEDVRRCMETAGSRGDVTARSLQSWFGATIARRLISELERFHAANTTIAAFDTAEERAISRRKRTTGVSSAASSHPAAPSTTPALRPTQPAASSTEFASPAPGKMAQADLLRRHIEALEKEIAAERQVQARLSVETPLSWKRRRKRRAPGAPENEDADGDRVSGKKRRREEE